MAAQFFVIPKEMNAVVYEGPNKIAVKRVPVSEPGEGQVLLKVTATTICGSDLHLIRGEVPMPVGCVIGHEPVGTIVKLGAGVHIAKLGAHVAVPALTPCGLCRDCQRGYPNQCGGVFGAFKFSASFDGCQAEFVVVPNADYNCTEIPEGDFLQLRAKVQIGDSVAVFACGPIGLCAVAAAKIAGATTVIAVDMIPNRLAKAKEMGAAYVLDSSKCDVVAEIKKLTGGVGVDIAVEALGKQATFENCLKVIQPGGTVSSVGVYCAPITIDPLLIGTGCSDHKILFNLCPGGGERLRRLLNCVRSHRINAKALITHHFKLTDALAAYDLFGKSADGCVKVILTP